MNAEDGLRKKDKVLVTGASGFLGSNIALRISIMQGIGIRIFIPEGTWHPYLDGIDMEVVYGDIRDAAEVRKAMEGCNKVIHTAGVVSYSILDDEKIRSVNIDGTGNILEAALDLGVEKVVVTGSTAGIGIPEDRMKPLDESEEFNLRRFRSVAYMHSKHRCIELCRDLGRKGLDVAVISPTTMMGAGDACMNVGGMIKKISRGELKFVPPGGNSFVSVNDAVTAHLLALDKGKRGENYIISSSSVSYRELFNKISDLLHVRKVRWDLPNWCYPFLRIFTIALERLMAMIRKRSPIPAAALMFCFKFRYFNADKARKELGWVPIDDLDRAIEEAISFYREQDLL